MRLVFLKKCAHAAMSASEDMPYQERKKCYAHVGRVMRRADTDPALVAKYEMLRSDVDRFNFMKAVMLDPSLASNQIEEQYKVLALDKHKDLYVTATYLRSRGLGSHADFCFLPAMCI